MNSYKLLFLKLNKEMTIITGTTFIVGHQSSLVRVIDLVGIPINHFQSFTGQISK